MKNSSDEVKVQDIHDYLFNEILKVCPEDICDGSGKSNLEIAPDDFREIDCICKIEDEFDSDDN